jgi:ABC-2 type transport system permease protein
VGIADEDGSDLSRQIAEALVPPTFQRPVHIQTADIDRKMDHGNLLLVVEIPPNFEADIRSRRQTSLQIGSAYFAFALSRFRRVIFGR